MIVTSGTSAPWRTVARRGMLFSECDAVEAVGLPPDDGLDLGRPDGVEKLWLVIGGGGHLDDGDGGRLDGDGGRLDGAEIGAGDVVLVRATEGVRFRAGSAGLDLLLVAVTPASVSGALPARRPVTG